MTVLRSVVLGCGSYLPARILSNDELARSVETTDEWIVQRTGIRERHIAADGELTSDLALNAARAALANARVEAQSIDLIVLATSTPDHTFPATAVTVQAGLGITHGAAFDLQAVCSGFVYALSVADALLKGGGFKRALVIGAETFSRILDWTDRTTCVLFGDGAGAVVLEAQPQPGRPRRPRHPDRPSALRRPPQVQALCRRRAVLDPDRRPSAHGRPRGVQARRGHDHRRDRRRLQGHRLLTAADIDWFVPHQANKRIIDGSAHKLGIAPEKVVITVDRHGNTSAASIPLALADAVADRRIKRGDLVLLEAMGGGFTWGSALRWCAGDPWAITNAPAVVGSSWHRRNRPVDPCPKGNANIVDNSAGYLRRGQGRR